MVHNDHTIFFSILQLHAMVLHNRSSQAKLLKIDEAEEIFNVTENKTNSITDISFLKYYLDLGYCDCSLEKFFSESFLKKFLDTLNGWSRRKWLDSDCLGNSNSVQKKILKNCHSEIL